MFVVQRQQGSLWCRDTSGRTGSLVLRRQRAGSLVSRQERSLWCRSRKDRCGVETGEVSVVPRQEKSLWCQDRKGLCGAETPGRLCCVETTESGGRGRRGSGRKFGRIGRKFVRSGRKFGGKAGWPNGLNSQRSLNLKSSQNPSKTYYVY